MPTRNTRHRQYLTHYLSRQRFISEDRHFQAGGVGLTRNSKPAALMASLTYRSREYSSSKKMLNARELDSMAMVSFAHRRAAVLPNALPNRPLPFY